MIISKSSLTWVRFFLAGKLFEVEKNALLTFGAKKPLLRRWISLEARSYHSLFNLYAGRDVSNETVSFVWTVSRQMDRQIQVYPVLLQLIRRKTNGHGQFADVVGQMSLREDTCQLMFSTNIVGWQCFANLPWVSQGNHVSTELSVDGAMKDWARMEKRWSKKNINMFTANS